MLLFPFALDCGNPEPKEVGVLKRLPNFSSKFERPRPVIFPVLKDERSVAGGKSRDKALAPAPLTPVVDPPALPVP